MDKINWNVVIGLEVHVQINTSTKLFCGCPNKSLGIPNSRCCPICIGLPGSLPAPNKSAIEKAALFGIAVNSKINTKLQFSRKNYFYPDLPKGYQTSQFSMPICQNGEIFFFHKNIEKKINLNRAHLEEDAGKLIHSVKDNATYIDLNRCGSPLLEIVTEPELNSASEARSYLNYLKQLIKYLGISNCNMEKGQLRCDANVSINKFEEKEFGTRTEIKNINSFKFVEKAINHEIDRQINQIQNGKKIHQCTLQYDDKSDSLRILRSKEKTNDYRYFPCPDIPSILIKENMLNQLINNCPEIPIKKIKRFVLQYKLSLEDSRRICHNIDFANYFETLIKLTGDIKKTKNLLLGDISNLLKEKNVNITSIAKYNKDIIKLIKLQNSSKLSLNNFKIAIKKLFNSKLSLNEILNKYDLLNNEIPPLNEILNKVIKLYPKEFERFQIGEDKLKGFFIGKIMQETNGKANPIKLNDLIEKLKTHTN